MKANKIFSVVYAAIMGVWAMMSTLILFTNASDCIRASFNKTDPSVAQVIAFIAVIVFAAVIGGVIGAAMLKENKNNER